MKKLLLFIAIIFFFTTMNSQNNKALIIIDIQNDYFEGGAAPLVGTYEASLNAKILLDDFRKKNLPIIHIQHIANREGATFFVPNTFGAEIHENVKPTEGETLIIKHFPNSFRETDLQAALKEKNITDLVICGMMTSMCVDATTRAAKDFGYNCTVISDACAAPNLQLKDKTVKAEDVHNAFLAALSYYYATVITTQEYIK